MTETSGNKTTSPVARGASLADLVDERAVPSWKESFPASTLVKMTAIAVLFVAVNWRLFGPLVGTWIHDTNWTHGFVIPLFSLYLMYVRRDELLSVSRRVSLVGLPLVVLSILAIMISFAWLKTLWLCELSMIALLFSLVLYLGGWQVIRLTWLPIVFLVFAMPIPDLLYSRIAVPLQEFAAKFSSLLLQLAGVEIEVSASNVVVTGFSGKHYPLTVAEACSGVRSLMAFLALGVAWAYLENRPIWQRVALVASAVPVAILCNVLRVAITTTMYVLDLPELGQDFMHTFAGMLMLIPAALMFWGISWFLRSLFVEVDEDADEGGASRAEVTE